MKQRVLIHGAFWTFFLLLYLQQNPSANITEYLSWITVLLVCAVVIYSNLYFLLPVFFFRKKYVSYSIYLLALIITGALSLKLIFASGNEFFNISLLQHCINLFFFIIITSSLKFLREYAKKEKSLIKAENEQLKSELDLLKSQVNPHFLFNTLNNLYGLIQNNNNEKAAEITLKLADLMRYLLDSSKIELINLRDEIKFLEDYLTLEKIRLSNSSDINFEISGLDKEILIAPLLLIPLVENVFKHGLLTVSNNCYAHFSLSIQGKELYFEAKNSIGNTINKTARLGNGLNNLKKRLQLIYPERHQLQFEETDNQFKVILYLQL
ncbi:MAG: sensor histidine kinase [Bacteroidota bacterium]|jgi:LytS/YehU family sensor histidine kinase